MTLSANSITATDLSDEALRTCLANDDTVIALKAELSGYAEAQKYLLEAEDGYLGKIKELEGKVEVGEEIDNLQEQRLEIKNEYITQLKDMLAEQQKQVELERKWMNIERLLTGLLFIGKLLIFL